MDGKTRLGEDWEVEEQSLRSSEPGTEEAGCLENGVMSHEPCVGIDKKYGLI